MSEKEFMLDWIPTTALKEFVEAHWYYLPESLTQKNPKDWMFTMQELLCELNSRKFKVNLTITPVAPEEK
jgi:hypothetical protein